MPDICHARFPTGDSTPPTPNDSSGNTFATRDLQVSDGQDVIDRLAWLRGLAATRDHGDLLGACLARLEPFRC